MKKHLARIFSMGPPIPTPAERAVERAALRQRILKGPVRFDDITRLNALDDLDADWGCKLLRMLSYKLYKSGD